MAAEHKAKGNAAFSAGNFEEAAAHYGRGIEAEPQNHVLYSNRSAALASQQKYVEALSDAKKAVELKPDWAKGYTRVGAAASGLGEHAQAVEAYEKGLKLDPENAALKDGLRDAKAAQEGGGAQPQLLGPHFMSRLALNPTTREYLNQPDFMQMLRACTANPQLLNVYLKDPRFATALEVGLGISMKFGADGGAAMEEDGATSPAAPAPPTTPAGPETPAAAAGPRGGSAQGAPAPQARPNGAARATPEPQDTDMKEPSSSAASGAAAAAAAAGRGEAEGGAAGDEGDSSAAAAQPGGVAGPSAAQRQRAQQEKARGNAAYKAKRFEEALAAYDAALELDDTDISFRTNKAAVHFEMGDYEACAKECDAAVARGRELRSDYKLVAKALTRKGTALVRLDRLEDAVAAYQKALTEHRNADTLAKLQEAERRLKETRDKAYVSLELAEQEREQGNEAFKAQDYPKAVAHYTEALKRGPPGTNPEAHKLFSNRAACYTKLGAWAEGLKDADECIALAPAFPKGYSRKGHLQFFMKEYEKALATYEAGLAHDPDSAELRDGIARCTEAMTKLMRGDASEEELAQRRERAMADPEVQNILTDPVVRQVLQEIQENPRAGQKHLQNPAMAAKIMKLVESGIVQMK